MVQSYSQNELRDAYYVKIDTGRTTEKRNELLTVRGKINITNKVLSPNLVKMVEVFILL